MKSKILLFGLSLTLLFGLGSCKSKESAYKAAYEKAKQKEMEEDAKSNEIEEVTPITKSKSASTSTASFQKEKVTAVDGNSSGLKRYNVVIGSFTVKTNAQSLKERMQADGYHAILAQNERQMYRVIVASYDDKASAAEERDDIKTKYSPDFQDAWLLELQD